MENARPRWHTWILVQKNSSPSMTRLAIEMNRCLQDADIPEWMAKRKTTMIQKDPSNGPPQNNYRIITCLPMMGKILTAQIREEIYDSLPSHGLCPEEQKGFRKGSRGTGELLNIDQPILNESKMIRKNLAMAWTDCKKTYDMILQSWITNCHKIVINFIEKTMKTWRVELAVGGKSLVEAEIQGDILQGDALSLLLFLIAIITKGLLMLPPRYI